MISASAPLSAPAPAALQMTLTSPGLSAFVWTVLLLLAACILAYVVLVMVQRNAPALRDRGRPQAAEPARALGALRAQARPQPAQRFLVELVAEEGAGATLATRQFEIEHQ
jgi:hypothetical protein